MSEVKILTLWTVDVTLVQRFQFVREDFPVMLCFTSADPASFTEITKDCDENKENKIFLKLDSEKNM